MPADVTSRESVRQAVAEAKDQFGRIDVLVNNAGWDKAEPFHESDESDWDRIIAINLYGTLNTTKAVLPHLVEQGGGSIVNIGSDAGRVGSSGEAVYSAAKGGVIAFTKTLARNGPAPDQRELRVLRPPTRNCSPIGGDNPKLREALIKAIPFRRLAQPHDCLMRWRSSHPRSQLPGDAERQRRSHHELIAPSPWSELITVTYGAGRPAGLGDRSAAKHPMRRHLPEPSGRDRSRRRAPRFHPTRREMTRHDPSAYRKFIERSSPTSSASGATPPVRGPRRHGLPETERT